MIKAQFRGRELNGKLLLVSEKDALQIGNCMNGGISAIEVVKMVGCYTRDEYRNGHNKKARMFYRLNETSENHRIIIIFTHTHIQSE